MFQPLLSFDTEWEGPWEEHTLKEELKHLRSYQRQERELLNWMDAGNFDILEQCASVCGIDLDCLSVEAVEKVPNMPQILRQGFFAAMKWYILKKKIMQLVEYQAQQKQKPTYGIWPGWLRAQEVF